MTLRRKLWFGVGAFALINAGPVILKATLADTHGMAGLSLAAWAAGGEGGEMAHASPDLATDDVGYLTQLGLMQGHLTVGVALYGQGASDDAKVHMKHPQDELYASLLPALEARKAKGFDAELSALAADVEGGKPAAEAEKDLAQVVVAIDHARAAAPASLKTKLEVVLALTRAAADEYAQGVKDGVVVNRKEYEDAWGFVTVAKSLLDGLSKAERKEANKAYKKIKAALETLSPAWPNVVPPAGVETDASLLYAASARIELAILSIR